MASLITSLARQGFVLTRAQSCGLYRGVAPMGNSAKEEMNRFWAKNTRLNRPLSPHVTIYKWSIPMMMSIAHRGTGVALSTGISLFAAGALILPGDYVDYLELIRSSSFYTPVIAGAKFGLVFPITYHTFNGIRHLLWDTGKGLRMSQVYRSGYIVLLMSLLTSITLAAN